MMGTSTKHTHGSSLNREKTIRNSMAKDKAYAYGMEKSVFIECVRRGDGGPS